ncbi:MAG: phosphohistidine phosphatase SixA [Gammaproteobacteria bacterium]
MRIYLFRHGRAQDHAASDAERELTAEGEQQVTAVVTTLQRQRASIARILCSPYIRARQTAAILARELGDPPVSEFEALLPHTSPQELLAQLGRLSDESTVLVGHNPLLSQLLSLMVEGRVDSGYGLGTAHIAIIDCEFPAIAGGELLEIIQPSTPA